MWKRPSLWLAAMLPAFLFPVTGSASGDAPLNVAVSNWAPYKSAELPENGIVVDIVNKALARAGYRTQITYAPWKRSLKGAIDGTYDVVPAIWWTEERASHLAFSDPVITSRIVIISRADADFTFNGLEDLRGKVVGTASGWAYPEAFENADFITKEPVKDLDTNLRKLIFGRIQLVIGEEFAVRYAVHTKFKESEDTFRYSKSSLRDSDLHVAFSKRLTGYREVRRKFNAALKSMRADVTLNSILEFHGVSNTAN